MKVEELAEQIIDYRGKTPPKTSEGIPLITAKVIKGGRILQTGEFISEETYASWMRRGLPQQWDLLVTTEAPLGEVALLRTPERIALAQRVILLRGHADLVDQRYLSYAFQSPLVQERLRARATGTTVQGIKQSELRQLDVPVPPVSVQKKTAAVLAAYDELIENNLRRIEILEEMAQAVYREWFVNFRFPGHEDVILVDSPLGPIPEGWSSGTFGDLAENQRVNVNPLKSPDEQFDHFSFAAFDEGRLPSTELGETMKSGKLLVERDSVLLAKLNPRIPRVWFARPGGVRRSVTSSEFLVLTSRTGSALELLYAICGDPSFQSRLATMSAGTSTSHQRLKLDDLMRLPMPIASKSVVEAFVAVTRPMYCLVTSLTIQNANLRATRDLLLPKLVSGEIDVSDLDIETEWLAS